MKPSCVKVVVSAICLLLSVTAAIADPAKPPKGIERYVNAQGVRGKLSIKELPGNRIAISFRTKEATGTDTVSGHGIFPVLVSGGKQSFYFGRMGASRLPMLVVCLGDPNRVQDSRILTYQVGSKGTLIGQQVVVDEAIRHRHTDEVSGGRYQLAAIDPAIGAIYSVAYQEARFEGFLVGYEKLRIRQWDAEIGAFIETDNGFVRDKSGKLFESTRFHVMNDARRAEVFRANLDQLKFEPVRHLRPKATPAIVSKTVARALR